MVYLLYHRPRQDREKINWSWITKWAGLHGIHPVFVDPTGDHARSDQPPFWFSTIRGAYRSLPSDLTWVLLDHRSEHYLDEYKHPQDDVIYCLGDDFDGFGTFDPEGAVKLKMRSPSREFSDETEHYASVIATVVLHDRHMFLSGRRAS